MGKSKKLKPSQLAKNVALADQIEAAQSVKAKHRNKERTRHDDDDEVGYSAFIIAPNLFNLRH